MVSRAIKSQGGYDRTSAFVDYQTGTEASQDPADYIEYTQELADSDTWYRFGMTTEGNQARDGNWWGETNPQYDQSKGLFGGLTAPAGVDHFFDFSENTAFNNAQTSGSLKYTQALGPFSLKECQVGDLVLARFDFNVMPMVTNTTVQVALIYANRDENDAITFTFPLTITPFFYGSGSVGKGFLLRPTITAYMANQQDVNSRSLVAIKADNPILVNPIGVLFYYTTMNTIRVVHINHAGNCINFFNSTQPVFWNGCLSAEVSAGTTDRINIENNIRDVGAGSSIYEFFRVPYTLFADEDNVGFSSAQPVVDYINDAANTISQTGRFILSDSDNIDFKVDDSFSTILLDNGDEYPTDYLKASASGDNINITTRQASSDITIYEGLRVANVTINGVGLGTTQASVVNDLNSLFTQTGGSQAPSHLFSKYHYCWSRFYHQP